MSMSNQKPRTSFFSRNSGTLSKLSSETVNDGLKKICPYCSESFYVHGFIQHVKISLARNAMVIDACLRLQNFIIGYRLKDLGIIIFLTWISIVKILSNPKRGIQMVHMAFTEVKPRNYLKIEWDDHCYKKEKLTLPVKKLVTGYKTKSRWEVGLGHHQIGFEKIIEQ